MKEVVDAPSVNPNAVVKTFSELEHQGVIVRRQGVGTFVAVAPPLASLAAAPGLLGPAGPLGGEDDRHAAGGAA